MPKQLKDFHRWYNIVIKYKKMRNTFNKTKFRNMKKKFDLEKKIFYYLYL